MAKSKKPSKKSKKTPTAKKPPAKVVPIVEHKRPRRTETTPPERPAAKRKPTFPMTAYKHPGELVEALVEQHVPDAESVLILGEDVGRHFWETKCPGGVTVRDNPADGVKPTLSDKSVDVIQVSGVAPNSGDIEFLKKAARKLVLLVNIQALKLDSLQTGLQGLINGPDGKLFLWCRP